MRTVLNEPPPAVSDWLAQRQAKGQDLYDEVWEGTYHVAPAPHPAHGDLDGQLAVILHDPARAAGLRGSGPLNVGQPDDYRVPDRALLRGRPTAKFVPTVAVVVEIVWAHDETWDKLDFYFARDVEEVLIVDPATRGITWLVRGDGGFVEADRSALLDLAADDLSARIDWPPLA